MTAVEMTPEESARFEAMLGELHQYGYQDVEEHGKLRPGVRIRHHGHQWSAAYANGSGVVLAITEKPKSAWSQTYRTDDVELIAMWDVASFGSRLSQVAQYHVEVIGGAS